MKVLYTYLKGQVFTLDVTEQMSSSGTYRHRRTRRVQLSPTTQMDVTNWTEQMDNVVTAALKFHVEKLRELARSREPTCVLCHRKPTPEAQGDSDDEGVEGVDSEEVASRLKILYCRYCYLMQCNKCCTFKAPDRYDYVGTCKGCSRDLEEFGDWSTK
jgi:hypothetical protein